MKEQTRNTDVQINEEEIGKLPEKEFRIMVVKMTKNLEMEDGENAKIEWRKHKKLNGQNAKNQFKKT